VFTIQAHCSLCKVRTEYLYIDIFMWRCGPPRAMAFSILRFLDHKQQRATVGRTPLDEWAAHRRDLQLTTQNIHKRQTLIPSAGFEPAIPASERPQTYAIHRAATGTGEYLYIIEINFILQRFNIILFTDLFLHSTIGRADL